MAEMKTQIIQRIKTLAGTFAEQTQAEQFSEAWETARELNAFLKSEEVAELEDKDFKDIEIQTLRVELAKFWTVNQHFRQARGALLKKGEKISAAAGL